MVRVALTALVAALALGGAVPALGQNAAASKAEAGTRDASKSGPPGQRYRFSHTAEGVLRLDNETGEVVLCRPLNGGWVCNPAPQEADLLKVELKRKDDEVKKLAAKFIQLKDDMSQSQGTATAEDKSLQEQIAKLQAAIASLKADVAALSAAKPADTNAQGGVQGITQEERRDIVSRLALLEQDNSGLKGALKRVEDENAALKKRLAEAPKAPDLEPAIAQAIEANDALKRDLADANGKIARIEKQVSDDSARRSLTAAVAQARDANETLKSELAATKDQLAALQKQIADQSDRNAQRAEIARLKDENRTLTDRIASLETNNASMQAEIDGMKPPPPLPKADVPSDKKDELKLPSREDMERAKAALTDTWRKLMEMIGQMQKHMLGGRDEPPVRL
jgi:predicted  nucleic acid-binding Zn-ribbon protein